jgi:hypothetical protein
MCGLKSAIRPKIKVTEDFSVTLWFNQDMLRLRIRSGLFVVLLSLIFAQACSPQITPTPFRPPTQIPPTKIIPTITTVPIISTAIPTAVITPTLTGPCSNNLTFVEDVTIPDGTTISVGASMDKQWRVQNSGTCNWDSAYRLKWIGGEKFGAAEEQSLFPARAGTQATLRIIFTAPTVEGTYESAWQAYAPDGSAFGDPIFMKITVIP